MAINNTLKDIREERNLIQADLAEAIGSCSQTIGRIERGERNPSLEIAIRLAHYLKVPVTSLNGPNVSYPLQPNFPTTLACFLSKICSMDL